MKIGTQILASLLVALAGTAAFATDPARESDLIDGVGSRYGKDAMVWLSGPTGRFAALLQEGVQRETGGGIVLLHGIDQSPDDPELLRGLRLELPQRGWTTLSLFAPLREAGADAAAYQSLQAEYAGRLQASLDFLAQRRVAPVALLGQRAGASMLIRYLAAHPDTRVAGLVVIELPDEVPQELAGIKTPVLDIIAGTQGDALARRRKILMKDNAGYRQLVITDAGRDLGVMQELLLNRIHGWLKGGRTPEAGVE